MPEEPVQTDPTPPSSVASGLTRGEEGSGLSSSGESSDDDSGEERERKLRDLQEQVMCIKLLLQSDCFISSGTDGKHTLRLMLNYTNLRGRRNEYSW